MAEDGTCYTFAELGDVLIVNDRIYDHKTLRVNFSTYDMRREYDIINPSKHANVMCISPSFDHDINQAEDGHPFLYARVLGVYHAEVIHSVSGSQGSTAQTMEFLFVRWYNRDATYHAGFQHRRLHRLSLGDADLDKSYGFLDPDEVIRGCHLIPAFAHGRQAMASVIPQQTDPPLPEWKFHYVNW